jgi:hypothetical protein
MAVEWMHRGKPTALGFASGVVAGLVAITPASGFVTPLAALVIGLVAGVVCYGAVCLKPLFKYDDSLDAFGVHGVGGFLGAVLTGVFASAALYSAGSGSDLPETWNKLPRVGVQLLAASVAVVYSFLLSLVLVKVIDLTMGFCSEPRKENEGLDQAEHGEAGFDFGPTMEMVPEQPPHEPKPASMPPDGYKRFSVVVEGISNGDLMHAWSDLCQTGVAHPPEFLAVYPNMTTVQGNRFRFRGGNPDTMRENLERLFQTRLAGAPIRARVDA